MERRYSGRPSKGGCVRIGGVIWSPNGGCHVPYWPVEGWEGVLGLAAPQFIDPLMEPVGRYSGDGGDIVITVGGLGEKDTARFEDAGNFTEDLIGVFQVFEDVVGENNVERIVGVGDSITEAEFGFVEIGFSLTRGSGSTPQIFAASL